jgi:hypothetical protein
MSEHIPFTPRSQLAIQNVMDKVLGDEADLKKVNLAGKDLSSAEAKKLIEALKNNTSVEYVDFSNNVTLDDNAVDAICDLIETSTSIKKLFLEGTSITKVARILHSMKRNKNIVDMTLPEAATDEELDLLDEILDENEEK